LRTTAKEVETNHDAGCYKFKSGQLPVPREFQTLDWIDSAIHQKRVGFILENLEFRVKILRDLKTFRCLFIDHFKGFGKVDFVKRVFGDEAAKVLAKLEIEFTSATLYMRVDDLDGHLMINPKYFLKADIMDLYLDVVHELVHVKQFLEGKSSDKEVNYAERPLEIEAYRITVDEARALGVGEDRILDYLDSELLNNEELKQLAEMMGVEYSSDYSKVDETS
jgi:hypothetical protein